MQPSPAAIRLAYQIGTAHKETPMAKPSRLPLVAIATSVATMGAFALSDGARAAQTTMTISMAAPPAAPRVQPPFVVGAHPSAPFLYPIPATGQSPLTFSATGLPAGLALGAGGIISGTAPAAGS